MSTTKRPFQKGDRVKCVNDQGTHWLTLNKEYKIIKDEEPGIFATWPYVTVLADNNETIGGYYASRFELIEEAP